MRRNIVCAALLSCVVATSAQEIEPCRNYGQTELVHIWDNSSAPHSNYLSGEERYFGQGLIENISSADMYIYAADSSVATGQAVVICPGGGYKVVAFEHEGVEMAQWLAANGITAAVLKYRMPNSHKEVPLEDVEQALFLLRERNSKYGFGVDSVGVVGFSAGGHLAATASNLIEGSAAPNFSVLLYPVISSADDATHRASFDNLLGADATDRQREKYSMDRQVSENSVPTFLALSDDDEAVPTMSSVLYYSALKRFGISSVLYIYPSGGHGWGMHSDFKYAKEWQCALLDWLDLCKR